MRVIDSHTEGEPTRVVIEGGPELGDGPLSVRVRRFAKNFDSYRSAIIHEPRGSEAVVGALLCEPEETSCAAGVIFFNNKGYLGMCGHGAIGVAVTLAYLDRIGIGTHSIETPVGIVSIDLIGANEVAIENVPSYRYLAGVSVEVTGAGTVTGDVAWGGNWFFLVDGAPLPLEVSNVRRLTDFTEQVKTALQQSAITGADNAEIDHIELFTASEAEGVDSRNFVLCPGGAYDRSPCGTGTSAKLACLAAAGKLQSGETWVQESIIGSRFVATYRQGEADRVIPTITGRAYVCSEATLIQHPDDPFAHGIR